MIKVLYVIESLGRGGAERMLVTLVLSMMKAGHKVGVAVFREPYDLLGELRSGGVEVFLLENKNKWNLLQTSLSLKKIINKYNYNIIHAHLYFPGVTVAFGRLFFILRCRNVITFHNMAYKLGVNKGGLGLMGKKTLAKILYKNGYDEFISVSKSVAIHMQEKLEINNSIIIYNPVDVSNIDINNNISVKNKIKDRFVILLPGRLNREKGQLEFMEVILRILKVNIEVIFVLAGGGVNRKIIQEEIINSGFQDRILITGELTHQEMLAYIAHSQIIVMPSKSEGFGISCVEAMMLKKPVVVYNVGGLGEIVIDKISGCLIEYGDLDEYEKIVKKLILDKSLRDFLGKNAVIRAHNISSVESVVQEHVAVYHKMIG